jgi:hypothetical protein
METNYRELVERAGGLFVAAKDGTVLFRSDAQGRILRLYAQACRTIDDVRLALKSDREQVRELTVWEKAG